MKYIESMSKDLILCTVVNGLWDILFGWVVILYMAAEIS